MKFVQNTRMENMNSFYIIAYITLIMIYILLYVTVWIVVMKVVNCLEYLHEEMIDINHSISMYIPETN